MDTKYKILEQQIARLMGNSNHSIEDEDKEMIEMLHEELKKNNEELETITRKNNELKTLERKYIEQINSLKSENVDLHEDFSIKESEFKEQINMLENLRAEYNRNIRIYEIESQNSKDLLRQYEEEMEKLRFAKKQAEQLSDVLKRQLEDLKNNESTYKLKIREEVEQDVIKIKNSIQSITAKNKKNPIKSPEIT